MNSRPDGTAPDVVVFDAEQRSSLAVVRSLGKRGLNVFAAGRTRNALAMASRYCKERLVAPDPAANPLAFSKWVSDIGCRWPGVVVFPLTDLSTPPTIAAYLKGARVLAAFPPSDAYETVIDKFALGKLADRAGLKVPETVSVSRGNLLRREFGNLRFPVVVKPRRSVTSTSRGVLRRGASYADSERELLSLLHRTLVDDDDQVLVQQFVEGTGMGVFALYEHGRPRFFFSHRRIREKPPSGGVSVLSESRPLPAVIVQGVERLLTSLNWHGAAMAEFKVGEGGEAWLMEINARLWGSVQLAIDSRADFPSYLFDLAVGNELMLPKAYVVGRQLRWLLGDLDGLYITLKASGITFGQKVLACSRFLVPWYPRMRYELLRLDDPMPALREAHDYIVEMFRRTASKERSC